MGDKIDINRIIPIVKHYEYCEKTFHDLKNKINEPINDFYNTKASVVFNAVERSGIRINREKFESYFHPIDGEYAYTQFNFKTLTGRPSNCGIVFNMKAQVNVLFLKKYFTKMS